MWGPYLGHKRVIFWPCLGLLIHWVVKWKTGHSCRPLVLSFVIYSYTAVSLLKFRTQKLQTNYHKQTNKTRGLQLCPVFHFTTQWFSNPRCGQNMTTLLPKYCPSNGFFLNLNQCTKGCSMPNFTLLGVSCSPLSYIWPKYGNFMSQTWSFALLISR